MGGGGEIVLDLLGELKGKTALVTGASQGIGLAVARALADAGAWVGMVARTERDLAQAAELVGGHAIPADISEAADVHRIGAYLHELLGGAPDLLVNAAGSFVLAPFAETDPMAFDRQVGANLRGPYLLTRAFLPEMLERGDGHIINIGSVAGRVALPGNSAYAASKFGLRGMHEVLSEEVRGTGVCATLIEPAATDTPLWDPYDPDSRPDLPSRSGMLRPEDVARAVVFVAAQPRGVEIHLLSLRAN
jgi:NAD(P)-dependent dehydrogenase (short-subunit alcohol dehydrogenase family)